MDWIDKLERAKRLLDAGALTPEEFEAEKAKLLPPPDVVSEASEPSPLLRKARRSVEPTLKLIALGALGVVSVGLAAWYFLGPPPQPSNVSQALVADPRIETGTLAPLSQTPTTSPLDAGVLTSQCKDDELKVNLPGVKGSGSVVINYPLDDTDGMGTLNVRAAPFICITPAQISRFATPSNNASTASDVRVGFSPTSTGRNPIDYSVLFCSELPDTPRPPRNLKVGSFKWLGRAAAAEVTVHWYPDYRKQVESDCFCEDGSQQPCAVAEAPL